MYVCIDDSLASATTGSQEIFMDLLLNLLPVIFGGRSGAGSNKKILKKEERNGTCVVANADF